MTDRIVLDVNDFKCSSSFSFLKSIVEPEWRERESEEKEWRHTRQTDLDLSRGEIV